MLSSAQNVKIAGFLEWVKSVFAALVKVKQALILWITGDGEVKHILLAFLDLFIFASHVMRLKDNDLSSGDICLKWNRYVTKNVKS